MDKTPAVLPSAWDSIAGASGTVDRYRQLRTMGSPALRTTANPSTTAPTANAIPDGGPSLLAWAVVNAMPVLLRGTVCVEVQVVASVFGTVFTHRL